MARRYRSRRGPGNGSIAAMVAAGILAALALALVWRFTGVLGEIAFLGMAIRALAIGALLAWVCQRTRFNRARAAATLAALATALSILGSQYLAHLDERATKRHAAESLRDHRLNMGSDAEDIQAHYEETLASLSLGNYLRRHFGIRGPASDGASNLMGPIFGIGLFSLEFVVALLVSMYLPAGRASEPVCDVCGAWLHEETLGRAKFGTTAEFVELLLANHSDQAMSRLVAPDTQEYLQLALARCPEDHQADAGVLRLREHFVSRRGRHMLVRHRADLSLVAAERQALDAAIARLG